jgi:oligopeptide/dipeptide ABC transporter ATP-binding protein
MPAGTKRKYVLVSLLRVENVTKDYTIRGGVFRGASAYVRAVDDVSFTVEAGKTFGLVGESGCGKSTLSRIVLSLEKPSKGRIEAAGRDPHSLGATSLKAWRRDVQIVAQDPSGTLPPRMRVRRIVEEAWRVHGMMPEGGRGARAEAILQSVGIAPYLGAAYPHQLSGGQRQRVLIARAVALEPRLVVCDEPVSALDVSVQAQVLDLLRAMQKTHGLTYLFISHDLGVIRSMADEIAVMFAGRLVERGLAQALYDRPLHPYTRELLDAMPSIRRVGRRRQERAEPIRSATDPGQIERPSAGCAYRFRCRLAIARCEVERPQFRLVEPSRWSACHRAEDLRDAGSANFKENSDPSSVREARL